MQFPEIDVSHSGPTTVRDGLNRQGSVLAGLAILGLVVIAFVSLASWSVNDPSLSVSSDRPTQNWLGYVGAVFADLAIQFFGLASALLLIPPALWGWSRLLQQRVNSYSRSALQYLFSIPFVCAALSCFSIPQSWPLPLGLGGVTGDTILRIPAFFGLPAEGIAAFFLAVVFGLTGGWFLFLAAGIIRTRPVVQADGKIDADMLSDEDGDDEPSWLLGALNHYYYAWIGHRFQGAKAKAEDRELDAAENMDTAAGGTGRLAGIAFSIKAALAARFAGLLKPEDDGLEGFSRSEPSQGAGVASSQGPAVTTYGENVYETQPAGASPAEFSTGSDGFGPDETELSENLIEKSIEQAIDEEWGIQPAPSQTALPASQSTNTGPVGRVQAASPPPQPSKRLIREAQPSLLQGAEFELPSLHVLQDPPPISQRSQLSNDALEQNARMLESVLQDFGVKGEIINVRPGPVVTLYELEPAPGIKSARIIGLADDIARSMSAIAARVAVIPGRNAIGIELPNASRETVYIREILASKVYENAKAKLPLILGKTIGGEATVADLAKMPHLLVAGTTGSGKSVAINTIIMSLLYRFTPDQVKLIMIDPKMLELSIYDGIPHLLTPVVTDPKKAVVALKWTVREMEERYKKMSKIGVRNIDGFNTRVAQAEKKGEQITRTIQTGFDQETGEAIYETETMELEAMPYIVVIIDEMADLMMVAGKEIEGAIQRLAQMARAAGIHVIMATQRPSTDVITGTIKANFPTRISFQVTSKIDSRVMLGESGAEQLLGMGDMLYMAGGGRIQRLHGPFVADDEVDQVVNHLKSQGVPQYLDSVTEETEDDDSEGAGGGGSAGLSESNDIYDQAVAVVLRDRKVSTSYIQRRLAIGYNRAASLIERMEQEGLISAANHAGKREILVPAEDETI